MLRKQVSDTKQSGSIWTSDRIIQGINYELQHGKDEGLTIRTIETANKNQIFKALSRFVMKEIMPTWVSDRRTINRDDLKQTYYFSMEFLIGRALGNNLINLGMYEAVETALKTYNIDLADIEEQEDEAGLGNGGLGRLAACYLESAATLNYPVQGMGLWYTSGIFLQEILDGYQIEKPDHWLRHGYQWKISDYSFEASVKYGGRVEYRDSHPYLAGYEEVSVMPRFLPIIGYDADGQPMINTLTLWRVKSNLSKLDMEEFNAGNHDNAVLKVTKHKKLTSILYPNENSVEGKRLRLRQEFLLVSAGLQMITRDYEKKFGNNYDFFADKVTLQINDTHPVMLAPELIRIIVDEKKVSLPEDEIAKIFAELAPQGINYLDFFTRTDKGLLEKKNLFKLLEENMPEKNMSESTDSVERIYYRLLRLKMDVAKRIASQALAYTNHTVMAEALEKWNAGIFRELFPRQYEIICEINDVFCNQIRAKYPGDEERVRRMSIVEEGQVRMAYLAFVISHSVNGVAALHTEILKNSVFKDFNDFFPNRINNKTNGITPRRWLKLSNPRLSAMITRLLGDEGWVTDLSRLKELERFADDETVLQELSALKQENKIALANFIYKNNPIKNRLGQVTTRIKVDPSSIFITQSKRLHEYKRQMLTALYIHSLYNFMLDNPQEVEKMQPKVFIFGAKAAPGYQDAKDIIKYINILARQINTDAILQNKLKVVFMENYNVSKAQVMIPATDISLQISTAGMEASGTGNMKFALNGALTVGTLDGANVEMLEEIGEENMIIFGRRTEEIALLQQKKIKGEYSSHAVYEKDLIIQRCLNEMINGYLARPNDSSEHAVLERVARKLLNSDPYFILEDFAAFSEAMQKTFLWYEDQHGWARRALLNIARIGRFSSDRSMEEYAQDIWNIQRIEQ